MHDHIHGRYYPHIDGIRALAVVPVVLYHVMAALCPGGYVGVDVFFVISGYLITKGILRQLEEGKFTVAGFYERRIRRIIPAYLVMLVCVLMASAYVYEPLTLGKVTQAASYSAGFAANIYFYLKAGGYFELTAEQHPLLHLWSLGVEEQFYIIVPIVMLLIYKCRARWLFPCLLVLAVASFVVSVLCSAMDGAEFNFYMLPTRAWELLAGSLLAHFAGVQPKWGKAWLGLVGMGLCLGACLVYSDDTAFPGLTAIPPVLGTMLMIRYGFCGWAGRVLASPHFVWVGRISYSLYLWHWPVVVFWRYLADAPLSWAGVVGVLAVSVVLGWASWRWVEMPVRVARRWNLRRAVVWVVAGCGAVLLVAPQLADSAWVRNRSVSIEPFWRGVASTQLPPSLVDSSPQQDERYQDAELVVLGKDEAPSYLLLGDSHANALAPGFDAVLGEKGINGVYLSRGIIFNGYPAKHNPHNPERLAKILDWIEKQPIKTIVLNNCWTWALSLGGINQGPPYDIRLENELFRLCARLKRSGKNIVIISGTPDQNKHIPQCLDKHHKFYWMGVHRPQGVTYAVFKKKQDPVVEILRRLELLNLAKVIWIDDFFFSTQEATGTALFLSPNGESYYRDCNHLSPAGARALIQHLLPRLLPALQ